MRNMNESGDKHFQKQDTVKINRENVFPTANAAIEKLSKAFNLPEGAISLVGSAGKKPVSGDLDIAIDQNELQRANGLETP